MTCKFILKHDKEYDGSCPCSDFELDGFHVSTHCWRVSCIVCEHSGLHIHGKCDIHQAQQILRQIKVLWDTTDWTIYLNGEVVNG